MFVSGVAIGQWNAICKNKEGRRRTIYKIARAICVGDVTLIYPSGNYIIRYHDINLLVDVTGCVNTVWRDVSRPVVDVEETIKSNFDHLFTHNEVLELANDMHKTVMAERKKVLAEQRQLRGEKVS
ncbi:hypothetical protein [Paenibacillus sp. MMO-177]|uniref:hypothetical protein n=1 Tax=Paenibacillus sp. MMO-177 TaxID=3081289 RepID=UPI0030181DF2